MNTQWTAELEMKNSTYKMLISANSVTKTPLPAAAKAAP
jgi:hypothetical protein